MIDATHKLPLKRQAELLELSRSNVYYLPRPVSDADLALMRRVDELHLNFPFAGARMLRDMLKLEGMAVGCKHIGTLMAKRGLGAIYRKRNTSAPHPAHPIYPYLLRNLTVDRPNQVRFGAAAAKSRSSTLEAMLCSGRRLISVGFRRGLACARISAIRISRATRFSLQNSPASTISLQTRGEP